MSAQPNLASAAAFHPGHATSSSVALEDAPPPAYDVAAEDARRRASASGTRAPAARLRLLKELAVMATSLPLGVWVRADEVRNDAL